MFRNRQQHFPRMLLAGMPTQTSSLRAAVRLVFFFAALKLAVHLACTLWQRHLGYGYFRDEFYYIACGRHLAWGYVDHGPVVALQARASEMFFGHSLAGLRFLSSVGGALRVALTGLLVFVLGGRRPAQALAMLAVLTTPMYLGQDGYLSMNSWESAFWLPCVLAVVQLAKQRNLWLWWSVFGVSAGIGLLNKPSMTFFLVALGIALLLLPQRRLLFTRQAACGIAFLLLIAAPNLLWQVHNHWPTLEFLHNGRVEHKNIHLALGAFLLNQFLTLGPWTALVWLPGLVRALRRPDLRWIGITFLFFLAGMVALGAKDYYVTPIYPVLYAVGGIAWEVHFADSNRVQRNHAVAFPLAFAVMILFCLQALPLAEPILRPATYLAYQRAFHQNLSNSENTSSGPLPQFYADRFGWQEEADQVQRTVDSLSPQDRAQAVILTENYGEAGALDVLGHNLPPVLCGQNNYWLWGNTYFAGHPAATGQVVVLVENTTTAHLQALFDRVELVGTMDTTPWAMPYQRRRKIWLLHGFKSGTLANFWPEKKHYI